VGNQLGGYVLGDLLESRKHEMTLFFGGDSTCSPRPSGLQQHNSKHKGAYVRGLGLLCLRLVLTVTFGRGHFMQKALYFPANYCHSIVQWT
jgi:hypothetical protein